MYKIAVMGDRDTVLGFKALGLDVYPCDNNSAKEVIQTLSKENYGIIYITEQLAQNIKEEIDLFKDALIPAIIMIPSKDGSLGIGMNNVKINVEKAVGADILDK